MCPERSSRSSRDIVPPLCVTAGSGSLRHLQSFRLMRPPESPSAEYLYANRWRIWGVVMIGLFMALIDVTIVNISIPQLQRDLDASVDTVSWVLNAYNIVFAVLLVSMGRLADQFGRRRFFLIGMTIFTLGSLLCALSWSIGALIAFRIVQAVGAGDPRAARARDHGARVPARPARPRPRDDGGGRERRRRARPADRRRAGRVRGLAVGRGLALDLPDQRPDRRARHRARAARGAGDPRPARGHRRRLVGDGRRSAARSSASRTASWRATSRGWGSPADRRLCSRRRSLLAVAFALTQRYGRYPMLTRGLVRNRQFMGASTSLLLFGDRDDGHAVPDGARCS